MDIRRISAIVLAAALSTFGAALAQDAEGMRDHPNIPRFPGTVISNASQHDFGSHEFALGAEKTRRVEGRFWKIDYAVKEGAKTPGPLEVARNYGNLFRKRGGSVPFEEVDASGGQVTLNMPTPQGVLWMEVQVANGGELISLTLVQEAALEQKVEFTAGELGQALAASGRVALHGIRFDTGKDTIRPESERLLGEVLALLQSDGGLRLRIEGHTDNVGKPADNMGLSRRRAEAVKGWLVGKGIPAGRMEAVGHGDTRPMARNDSEEGRASNRRVELVKS